MAKKFYLTTAIAYASKKPHVGNDYEIIFTDCLARYHRMLGEEVFLLTGTDEHGQKFRNWPKKRESPLRNMWIRWREPFRRIIRT